MSQKTIRPFHIFKSFETLLKVIDCTQQLQVREKCGGIWEGARSSKSDKRSNSVQVSELAQLRPWLL